MIAQVRDVDDSAVDPATLVNGFEREGRAERHIRNVVIGLKLGAARGRSRAGRGGSARRFLARVAIKS
jgi:hypothetical protein